MQDRYYATITHHSIASARKVNCGDDLDQAKKIADDEFGGDFLDYVIVIRERSGREWDETVASRKIADEEWTE
jgi:hypothetical protein